MDLVVVGANGLVGSRLCRTLIAQGHRVTGIARGPRRVDAELAGYHAIDLAEAASLARAVESARPAAVINCSAMTDVDGCERAPAAAYLANVEGVATLARAALAVDARLVHLSTDYVFDGDAGPYLPDAIPNPRGTYAITKHMGEEAVRVLCAPGRWTIARTAVVYGWPPAGQKNFGSWLYSTLRAGQPVKLFEDQWVSPSLASSVAAMVAELAVRGLPGVWHTAGAEVVDRVTFGRRFCAALGLDAGLITPSRMAELKLASPRPARSGLDVSATARALAARPLSIAEALDGFRAELTAAGEPLSG